MQRLFWVSLFKLLGWNTAVQFPKGVKKCIIIAGPHTHWLDFPVGLAYRSILRINQTRFLGKKELFDGYNYDSTRLNNNDININAIPID